jgi:hypothetical protein
MANDAESILSDLQRVDRERAKRRADASMGERVRLLKAYQQRRFAHTYADLLTHPRYQGAARFFLDELYGPTDFSRRDDQFARVVPATVRLFPGDIVQTVATLASLHALSEELDSQMAVQLASTPVDATGYIAAWQATGQPAQRELQIALTQRIGERLDRLTRNPLVRHSLRMMRGPAKAAGLSDLQRFLETGFETFRAMRGAETFLQEIGQRERALASTLFAAKPPFDDPGLLARLVLV